MIYEFKCAFQRIVFHYILRDSARCAKKLGVKIGTGCKILDDPGKVFGSEPWLVSIGNNCEITKGVRIITHEGGLWVARNMSDELRNSDIFAPVIIGNNVMIGNYSLLMPGTKIGDNVIIGGHSVITHDLESNGVYAGVPARRISSIEDFIEKAKNNPNRYDTKGLSQDEKRKVVLSEIRG